MDEKTNRKELTIMRMFDAPRGLVWKAWTDPQLLEKWWGPKGVTNPICEWNVRPGGKINIVMLAGKELGSFAGQKWPMSGTFKELVPEEKLVYTAQALDEKKGVLIDTINTLTLEKVGNRTRMTFHIVVTKTSAGSEFALAGMEMGWNQSLDKLKEHLDG